MTYLGLSRSWPQKKKQPSVSQRKANKTRWPKNIKKTHGNFFRKKKKIKPKKIWFKKIWGRKANFFEFFVIFGDFGTNDGLSSTIKSIIVCWIDNEIQRV